jgi:hypothetical protein
VSLEQFQAFLQVRRSLFLQYFSGKEHVYCLVVSQNMAKLERVPVSAELLSAVRALQASMSLDRELRLDKKRFETFSWNAYYLYKTLFGDLVPFSERTNKRLIVSADGDLGQIPFEVLMTRLPDSLSLGDNIPYLILQSPVSYSFSATSLYMQSQSRRNGDRLLAFGFSGTDSLPGAAASLPGTREEVEQIASIMRTSETRTFLDIEATESRFKRLAGNYNIVHLAVHGDANSEQWSGSHLRFRAETDSLNDGLLHSEELYGLQLNNLDLAVLSACESGIGNLQSGEGMMSMARGFAYAGCPSVLMSLWRVDDRSTAQLMADFYRYAAEGYDLDLALALAKRHYLSSAGMARIHPANWAAFVVVGDTRPIVSKINWLLPVVIFLLVLTVTVAVYRQR